MSWRYCLSLFIRRSASSPDWNSRSYDPLLLASEALILSRLITDGSNSIVIRFENTLILASITPRVLRSFSSKSKGRSPSFVRDKSRIPRARRLVETAEVMASTLPNSRLHHYCPTDCSHSVECSPEYLSGRFTLVVKSTLCNLQICISMRYTSHSPTQCGRPL